VRGVLAAAMAGAAVPVVVIAVLGAGFAAADDDQASRLAAVGDAARGDAQPIASAPALGYAGRGAGCTVPDPSGTGGCVTPAMAWLMRQGEHAFGHLPVSCWSARGGDPYSDHPTGKACDYTFGRIGDYPGPADVQRGWALASWLRANAAQLQVGYVIWQGRIWSRAHDEQGWRSYTGGGHYSATGPTNGHYDHVHVSTTE
jgi:hypothetical protein